MPYSPCMDLIREPSNPEDLRDRLGQLRLESRNGGASDLVERLIDLAKDLWLQCEFLDKKLSTELRDHEKGTQQHQKLEAELENVNSDLFLIREQNTSLREAQARLQAQVDDIPKNIDAAKTEQKEKLTQQYKIRDRQSREQREKLQVELTDKSKAFDQLATELNKTKDELSTKTKLLATTAEDLQKAKQAIRPPSGASHSRTPYLASALSTRSDSFSTTTSSPAAASKRRRIGESGW